MDAIKRYGPWAIVTGASQGIGEGFARELAARGYHIVLVSRRAEKLAPIAQELRNTYGVQARVATADLSRPGAGRALVESLRDLDVGLLISNAGGARMGGFLQNSLDDLAADLNLNALSHLELSHAFGSLLRTRGRSGGILMVSSTAALQPMAMGANYAGAKAFVHTLGESIHREFAEIDIDVSVLLPGPTDTHGLNHRDDVAMGNLPMTAMPVQTLVRQGLNALAARKSSHIAGWMNRMTALMPRRVLAWMFSTVLRRNTAKHLLPTAPIALPAAKPNAA
jgi:short-subunit dehydrogenase